MDDAMEAQVQPRCRDCRVVMRDSPGGWRCPACGLVIPVDQSIVVPVFSGPSIWGG
ncbi:hypothetical protein [uncultured Microbacterium sp.]|uniref:hypothetical protein n=1 Tax=uncultured Microbacterium sp. TaxID=191216 RepID=UPI002618AFB5|nr:hypothetical protein [uncultured Microbacterium sp.]